MLVHIIHQLNVYQALNNYGTWENLTIYIVHNIRFMEYILSENNNIIYITTIKFGIFFLEPSYNTWMKIIR